MRTALNICGAAIGLHAMAFSALAMLEAPPRPPPSRYVVEPVLLPVPVAEAAAPQPAARPAPRRRVAKAVKQVDRPRPAPQRALSMIAPAAPPREEPAPPREEPSLEPPPGSDAAVLLGSIARASRNDGGIDGGLGNADGDSAAAARGSAFLRGAARGVLAPSHESKAAPAEPVEDYTRLVPKYSDAAIEHDVSASVAMRVELDERGEVVGASVLKSAGYGLDEIALETVKKYRFRPARDAEGRPVRAVFGWRIVWESHWKRLVTDTIAGHPNCRGQGPMNLGEIHPVYIDCDGPEGYFELAPEQR